MKDRHAFDWLFWPKVLIDPVSQLDLLDTNGRPDHGKINPFVMGYVLLILKLAGFDLSIWEMLLFYCGSVGWSGIRLLVKSGVFKLNRNETFTQSQTQSEMRSRLEELKATGAARDLDWRIDPSP